MQLIRSTKEKTLSQVVQDQSKSLRKTATKTQARGQHQLHQTEVAED